jgi:alpha/beta superfamily hydrolase
MGEWDLVSVDGIALDVVVHEAAAEPPRNLIVLVHDLARDRDQRGVFNQLADRLAEDGSTVVRFSFRGHGASAGTQRGFTTAGAMLDLTAVVDEAARRWSAPLTVLAVGFGAVPTCQSLGYLDRRGLTRLILWSPVLDLRRTFLEPELPWGERYGGKAAQEQLSQQDFVHIEDSFELGRVLFEEFALYQPELEFVASRVPTLMVTSSEDEFTSTAIATDAAVTMGKCQVYEVAEADHDFGQPGTADEAIRETVMWMSA